MQIISTRRAAQDHFQSYDDLALHLCRGEDFRVVSQFGETRDVLVAAIHGGLIERGTSEIAHLIAEHRLSLYAFEGLKVDSTYDAMHITSVNFDEPVYDAMVRQHQTVVSIHGCRDGWGPHVMIGGLDRDLGAMICRELQVRGIPAKDLDHAFPALSLQNVCNRGQQGGGVQLEIPLSLRINIFAQKMIAQAVRHAILSQNTF